MIKDKKGSALIIVLIIMTLVIVVASSTVNLTRSEYLLSKSYNDSTSAYYIAEAGIERSLSIIKSGLSDTFINNSLAANTALKTDKSDATIKSVIDSIVSTYFSGSYITDIDSYQKYVSGTDGKQTPNGMDTRSFSAVISLPSYYSILINAANPSTLDAGTGKYQKNIVLNCTGYYGKSIKRITAEYSIIFYIDKDSSDYPDLDLYSLNAINIIGDPDNSRVTTLNGSLTVNGNVLLTGKTLNTNCSININKTASSNGVLAVRTDSTNFSGSTNINGDFILDCNNVKNIGSFNINNGNLYSSIGIGSVIRYNISQYNKEWGNKLLTASDHIKSFELKPIIETPDFPKNDRGIKYYYHSEKNPDISGDKFNGSYDVLVVNNDLTIDYDFTFNGLIYCNGNLTFTRSANITGVIIAKSMNMPLNSVNITYNVPNDSTDKIDDIKDIIEINTSSSEESGSVSIRNYNINTVSFKEN